MLSARVSHSWLRIISGSVAVAAASFMTGQEDPGSGDPVLNRRLLGRQHPVYPRVYDSHPVLVPGAKPGPFLFWHSFEPGAERLVGRTLGGRDTPFIDVSNGPGVLTPAEAASTERGTIAVAWSSWRDQSWILEGRWREGDKWTEVTRLSEIGANALQPTLAAVDDETFAIAWSEWRGASFELRWGRWTAAGLQGVTTFSDAATHAFRPQLVTGPKGALHAVWDAYARNTSVVYARQLLPELGPIEAVSTSPDRCMKPAAAHDPAGGIVVAWVRATDAVAAAGTIDQMHVIEAARRDESGWRPIRNERDGSELAWLTSGLLAQIEPKPAPTGGYMGRRRDPMFVRDGGALWLIWERKAPHAGTTGSVTGELLGRKLTTGRAEPVVALFAGAVDYRVPHDAMVHKGAFQIVASSLPRDGQREFSLLTVKPDQATPARTEPWPGWARVELPMAEAEPRRHVLREHGREYRLYWMDSHVHSALSADAEGEPDEILLYARDRGRLDAVVMQENDFFNCPLTDHEYQLGAFYSLAFSREGIFVALPGFEWTQRLPGDRNLPLDQPRFWGSSYPNHRTVIYPRAGGPLIRYTDVRNDIRRLYSVVAGHGGVMHTQHPDFDYTGAPGEVAIEVTAGWGIYFLNPGRIHATLNRGHRAGFVGTSDSHRRNPGLGGGLTGIFATDLSPDAILEAYRARRVFATSGARIAVEARAAGALMGREVAAGRTVNLTLKVNGSRPIRKATLLRDGVDLKVFTATGAATSSQFEYEVTETKPGTHWFYWRVEQEGVSQHYGGNVATAYGNLAWTTPNWVTFQP